MPYLLFVAKIIERGRPIGFEGLCFVGLLSDMSEQKRAQDGASSSEEGHETEETYSLPVIVAEDDPFSRELVRTLLEKWGLSRHRDKRWSGGDGSHPRADHAGAGVLD